MKLGRCCLISCCCGCVVILLALVAAGVMGFAVVRKGMEPPPGYVKSTVPLDLQAGQQVLGKVQAGSEQGQLQIALTREDLRNLIAAKIDKQLSTENASDRIRLDDVQVRFGNPAELPSSVVPRAYPVPVDKSVRLDLVVAVNFANPGDDPFVIYPLVKVLAGVNECKIYWTLVDIGIGPYSMLEALRWAERAGAQTTTSGDVQRIDLPAGACATELTHAEDSLRVVFGPESGPARATPTPVPEQLSPESATDAYPE
jgi:hypothetical protein